MAEQCKETIGITILKEGGKLEFRGNLFCMSDKGHTDIHRYTMGIED